MNNTQKKFLEEMGIFPKDFLELDSTTSIEEAEKNLAQLKAKFKVGFGKLANRLHPDKPSGDSNLLQELLKLQKEINNLKIQRPRYSLTVFFDSSPTSPRPVPRAKADYQRSAVHLANMKPAVTR